MSENQDDIPEQIRLRADKRQRLLDAGNTPYPIEVPITATITQIREKYAQLEQGEETEDLAGVAGRVRNIRNSGKLCFVSLQQGDGQTLQAMITAAGVGLDSLNDFKDTVDLGDHLFVHGKVISSKRGELSVMADDWRLACKSLRPLPKSYINEAGEEVTLSEEQRVRNREIDMIMRQAARDMVRTRYKVVRSIRDYFHERDYIEVETPMLQIQHGGAAARPFTTHMNAYDTELFLRIAPELFLKRCLIGGVDKVYEINRNFRNEGADSSHSPEFTMLEAYHAYGTYETIGQVTQDIIQNAARTVFGSELVTLADGTEYDLSGQWDRVDLYGSLSEALGEEITPATPRERLVDIAKTMDIDIEDYQVPGKIVEILWEEKVGDSLWKPTFVMDFPADTSPLVKEHPDKPGQVEKWDLIVRGFELATGYSELNDPIVQRERFEAQALDAANGDPEAMEVDEEFLRAMEHGMPPAGGMGMGIDRLLMALTGLGIRETITFPLVKRIH
ncbi:MAG: lysine--tRNA ligase [Actinomycetaceae bacterium]|nr:lysine--tRNA ligase [Actinomycetaceae bacterium]